MTIFHAHARAPEATAAAAPMLFNDPRFHALNLSGSQRLRRIDHTDEGTPVGSLSGMIEGSRFVSGFSAPFGGPDFSREDHTLPRVAGLLDRATAELRAEGVEEIRIRCRPAFYSAAEPVVHFTLLRLGFAIERADINQHVDLTALPSMADYRLRLKKKRARSLEHDLGGGLSFREAHALEDRARCHAVLEANRATHGATGLPLAYLERLRDTFPGAVRMYALDQDGETCAAALVYRVLPGRDLLVSWGDAGHDLPRSPMNLLAYRLVEESLASGARTLDLGPSTAPDGSPNAGLFHFKRSVLGGADNRFTFVWRATR